MRGREEKNKEAEETKEEQYVIMMGMAVGGSSWLKKGDR
jgi:hypothetical protein